MLPRTRQNGCVTETADFGCDWDCCDALHQFLLSDSPTESHEPILHDFPKGQIEFRKNRVITENLKFPRGALGPESAICANSLHDPSRCDQVNCETNIFEKWLTHFVFC